MASGSQPLVGTTLRRFGTPRADRISSRLVHPRKTSTVYASAPTESGLPLEESEPRGFGTQVTVGKCLFSRDTWGLFPRCALARRRTVGDHHGGQCREGVGCTERPRNASLRGHKMQITNVCFSADGKRLATASWDHTAKIWDAASGNELLTLRHEDIVDSVCFSADGERLATTSRGLAKIWDAVTSHEALTLREHASYDGRACFSPNGRSLATACGDGTIKVWEVAMHQQLLTLRVPAQRVTEVCYSPDGKRLPAATYDGIAEIRDAVNGERLLTLRIDWASEKALSEPRRQKVRLCPPSVRVEPDFGVHVFTPDGKRLATGQDDAVQISDAVAGKKLLILRLSASRVNSVCFSPDGRWLATGSICFNRDDGAGCTGATIWDATSGQKLLTLPHTNWVNCVCFSPDGKWLATACSDRVARLWDATSGQETLATRGHTSTVEYVSFSPDGKRLATASADQTAKIWDLASGQELLTLSVTNWLRYACFSPDGKRLATAEMGVRGEDLGSRVVGRLITQVNANLRASLHESPTLQQAATLVAAETQPLVDPILASGSAPRAGCQASACGSRGQGAGARAGGHWPRKGRSDHAEPLQPRRCLRPLRGSRRTGNALLRDGGLAGICPEQLVPAACDPTARLFQRGSRGHRCERHPPGA